MRGDKFHKALLAASWYWNGGGVYERTITTLVSLRLTADEHDFRRHGADNVVEEMRWGRWDLIVRTTTFANRDTTHRDTRICTYNTFDTAAKAVLGNR